MITPPLNTQSFYTALFEKDAAKFVTGLMSQSGSADVEQVLITSKDMTSDVEATNELQAAANEVMSNLVEDESEVDTVVHFNPIYLPAYDGNLFEMIDVDGEGDITAIAGFGNPFITMSLKKSCHENIDIIDAKVNWKQFQLPPINELLANKEVLLS